MNLNDWIKQQLIMLRNMKKELEALKDGSSLDTEIDLRIVALLGKINLLYVMQEAIVNGEIVL